MVISHVGLEVRQLLAAGRSLDSLANLEGTDQELADDLEVLLLHATGGEGRGADADTAWGESALVTVDGVLVESDAALVADELELVAANLLGAEIPQDKVVVSTAGGQLVALAGEGGSNGLRVLDNLLGVLLEVIGHNNLELSGNTSDGVVVRATLQRGEDSEVDAVLKVELLVLAEEDETRAGTTERLVGGGGHNVAVGEGIVDALGGDETADVGHVAHEQSSDAIGDAAEAGIVPITGVGAGTADEDLGAEEVSLRGKGSIN